MKNRSNNTLNVVNRSLHYLASLPGCAIDSKKAKQSKMIKTRALVFEREMCDNYEIIF